MVVAVVSNKSPLDYVLLGCEQEADKVYLCKNDVGLHYGIVGLLSNEELDVPEPEQVVGGIVSTLAVFACPEEEE